MIYSPTNLIQLFDQILIDACLRHTVGVLMPPSAHIDVIFVAQLFEETVLTHKLITVCQIFIVFGCVCSFLGLLFYWFFFISNNGLFLLQLSYGVFWCLVLRCLKFFLLLLFKIAFSTEKLLYFHVPFSNICSRSEKNVIGIFVDIFMSLILSIHGYEIFFPSVSVSFLFL